MLARREIAADEFVSAETGAQETSATTATAGSSTPTADHGARKNHRNSTDNHERTGHRHHHHHHHQWDLGTDQLMSEDAVLHAASEQNRQHPHHRHHHSHNQHDTARDEMGDSGTGKEGVDAEGAARQHVRGQDGQPARSPIPSEEIR